MLSNYLLKQTIKLVVVSALIITLFSISCIPRKQKKLSFNYKKYFNLPDDLYSPQQYLVFKEYDVISKSGKITNSKRLDRFSENIKKKKKDLIRIINFDPPIIYLLVFNGKDILYFQDSTRYEYGFPKIVQFKGKVIIKKILVGYSNTGNSIKKTVYYLSIVDDRTNIKRIIAFSKSYKKETNKNSVLESVKVNDSKVVDLNGDGKKDKIFIIESAEDQVAFIQVNNTKLSMYSTGELAIVDINNKDRFKEIAFWNGDEEDAETNFYYYDGIKLISMGGMSGSLESINIDGSGKIKTFTGSGFLHTWGYVDTYKLSKEHLLENIPQKLYEMNDYVTLASNLPLQKSRTNPDIIVVLKKGEKAKLLKTDNKIWCLAQNKNGKKGWFAINDNSTIAGTQKRPEEIFSDLNFAD